MNSSFENEENEDSRLVLRSLSPINKQSRRQPCLAFKLKVAREAIETSIRMTANKYK
jgi:hypothetical protein